MFLLLEPCDFETKPVGGQLIFCKQLLDCFGENIRLVGVNTSNEPVGKWYRKEISGKKYDCFNLYTLSKRKKPFVPLRLMNFITVYFYRRKILKNKNQWIFVHSPETMISLKLFNLRRFEYCFMFHGIENPLLAPRYAWGKIFAPVFHRLLFWSIINAKKVLVCADNEAIGVLSSRVSQFFEAPKLIQFPTCYDDSFFYPTEESGEVLSRLFPEKTVLVSVGRLSYLKGWSLLLDAFKNYLSDSHSQDTVLVFVGDGEDRGKLEEKSIKLGISDRVFVTGYVSREEVREFLWRADLVLIGSHVEGWSISMLEALACGKTMVSTKVSGASDMIQNNINGFVCPSRDPKIYAKYIRKALADLPKMNKDSILIATQYKLSGMRQRLEGVLLDKEWGFHS